MMARIRFVEAVKVSLSVEVVVAFPFVEAALPYLLVAEFVDFVRYIHLRIPSAGVEIEVNIRLVAAVASVVAVAVVGITATSSIAHSGLVHHSLEQGLAEYIAVADEAIPC